MLSLEQIKKRFKVDDNDASTIHTIQTSGLDYGKRGIALDSEEFKDVAEFDIEHTETLLDLKEGSTLRLFKAAYREGLAHRKSFCLPIDSVSEAASRPAGARQKQAQPKRSRAVSTPRRRSAANVTAPTVADDIAAAAKPDDQKSTWTAETPHA